VIVAWFPWHIEDVEDAGVVGVAVMVILLLLLLLVTLLDEFIRTRYVLDAASPMGMVPVMV
jgi:hypothetical protein